MKIYRLNAPATDEYFSSETAAKKRGMEIYNIAKEKGRSGDLYVSIIETQGAASLGMILAILNDDPSWKVSEKILWDKRWD